MEQTAEPVLDIRGLRTIFRIRGGEITAVNNIDLTVAAGETLALVGESGSANRSPACRSCGCSPATSV